jgi:hypothetical protein
MLIQSQRPRVTNSFSGILSQRRGAVPLVANVTKKSEPLKSHVASSDLFQPGSFDYLLGSPDQHPISGEIRRESLVIAVNAKQTDELTFLPLVLDSPAMVAGELSPEPKWWPSTGALVGRRAAESDEGGVEPGPRRACCFSFRQTRVRQREKQGRGVSHYERPHGIEEVVSAEADGVSGQAGVVVR